ncbi:putative membrane protein [Actinoplanes tereljensis]
MAHLPFLSAVSAALVLCAASAGFFAGGAASALGAALGVLIVVVSYTMSTLVIAWADTVRPALLMPLALLTYVVKYTVLGVVLVYGISTDWTGKAALGWGVVAGVVVWTAVQAWWFTAIRRPK